MGCPYQVNRGRLDQDGVFYRFFGPDPVYFENSLIFRTGARGDDMESMVYTYQTQTRWRLKSNARGVADFWPWPNGDKWETFVAKDRLPDFPSADKGEVVDAEGRLMALWRLRVDGSTSSIFYERHHGATPLTMLNHSAYAKTTIVRERAKQ